jgi:alpha-ketoglutarate-dependent taurine dioxygenase
MISADHLLDEGVPEACLRALDEHGVLVFPQICASDEVQVEFSSRLGRIQPSKFADRQSATSNLGIYRVSLDPTKAKFIDYIVSNEHWHMDGTTYSVPPKATSLKCEQAPRSGGDTEFADLFAAYEDLPVGMKETINGLRVVHSAEAANRKFFHDPSSEDLERWRKDGPPREQPLVWTQADGRSSMIIGSTASHIVGESESDGLALLDELLAWATQPKYCYRHQWTQGDMVIWNNPGLLHRAHRYARDSGRLMHRTTILGFEAVAYSPRNLGGCDE